MKQIDIYTTAYCPYCVRAKMLLERKGVAYREFRVDGSSGVSRAEVVKRSGGLRTVPQIFIGDVHVGGFDELASLEREGGLDALFSGE